MDNFKIWYEITYLFPNFNGAAVWVWISNFILQWTWLLIHAGWMLIHVSKRMLLSIREYDMPWEHIIRFSKHMWCYCCSGKTHSLYLPWKFIKNVNSVRLYFQFNHSDLERNPLNISITVFVNGTSGPGYGDLKLSSPLAINGTNNPIVLGHATIQRKFGVKFLCFVSIHIQQGGGQLASVFLGPLLLTWLNFNLNIDKWSHTQ